MNIFIIGFMCSGKTSLGKVLAEKLARPFFDLDALIEKNEGRSIKTIFEEEGETYFRKLETDLLLNWKENGVIATGGGIVENASNREFLTADDKITIWFNPDWSVLQDRLKGSLNRPLLNNFNDKETYVLWKRRNDLYKECADIVIYDPDLEKLIKSIKIFRKVHSR